MKLTEDNFSLDSYDDPSHNWYLKIDFSIDPKQVKTSDYNLALEYFTKLKQQILSNQEIVERLKEYGRKDNELFISTDPIQQLVDNFISGFVQSILGEQK